MQTFSESVVITTEDFGLFELHFRFLVPGVGGLLPKLKIPVVNIQCVPENTVTLKK